MKSLLRLAVAILCFSGFIAAAAVVQYNFNAYSEGPIDGQFGWNVYDKVPDSSALSVMDSVGTTEEAGDKALLIQKSPVSMRCVNGEPVRWLPGTTLKIQFDFKVGITSKEPIADRPVLTLMLGNSLLGEKARWSVGLLTQPSGDWLLAGSLPDYASKRIYGENLLIRPRTGAAVSDWHRFVLVVKKLSEPDSFEAKAEIRDRNGKVLASLDFTDEDKGKMTRGMWGLPRVNAGFHVTKDQYGLATIDNFVVSSTME